MGAILKLAYGNYNYQFECECTSVHGHFNSAHIVCVWNILKGDSFKQTQATAVAASTSVVIGRHIHTHTHTLPDSSFIANFSPLHLPW